MQNHFKNITLKATQSSDLYEIEMIQSLWSGYGRIIRLGLKNGIKKSVVAKHVKMPNQKNHPRGWNTDFSHLRKVKSYEVETNWYQQWAKLCDNNCKIPHCFVIESENGEVFMVLEDLDDAGYDLRKDSVDWSDIEACLKWLANFHATYLQEKPTGLWDIGTYWHLDTRPDELKIMDDKILQKAAPAVDEILNNCKYLTFVHGDAKLANFCFSSSENKVAAVDFQYVGGGCGMKDVAYFIGSCLYEEDCEKLEDKILNFYFKELESASAVKKKYLNFKELEKEWREMYPVAWTDFHRFLKGWSPSHWKINSYSEKMARQVIRKLS
ncbi:oxidoreductase family protein [Saccharicrinis aurantiacus]|uniref:oxidoreductase family protein n=1 Tax=Saccharicrinis aurantiacus TaxID=1849719 RepID=UPI00249318D9|nr:oxidoreductase family protein [Saccharicrinis aurantiacus]